MHLPESEMYVGRGRKNKQKKGKGKKQEPETEEDEEQQFTGTQSKQIIKRKTLQEILVEADPVCSQEKTVKFIKLVQDILKSLEIQTDRTDIVDTLMKIESKLNFYCEARDYLQKKDA